MPRRSKHLRQLQEARQAKQGMQQVSCSLEDAGNTSFSSDYLRSSSVQFASVDMEAHWEGYNSDETDEEECECTDNEDEADLETVRNAFNAMMSAAEGNDATARENHTVGLYRRGPKFSERHERRKRAASNASKHAAKFCKTLDKYSFVPQSTAEITQPTQAAAYTDPKEQRHHQLCVAISDMKKKLKSKEVQKTWRNQDITRHEAVLHFMQLSLRRGHIDTREKMALQVANCFGKGVYFARKIVQWEGTWIRSREIEEGRQGCYSKVQSWFNDEGVHLAVPEYLAGAKEGNRSQSYESDLMN